MDLRIGIGLRIESSNVIAPRSIAYSLGEVIYEVAVLYFTQAGTDS